MNAAARSSLDSLGVGSRFSAPTLLQSRSNSLASIDIKNVQRLPAKSKHQPENAFQKENAEPKFASSARFGRSANSPKSGSIARLKLTTRQASLNTCGFNLPESAKARSVSKNRTSTSRPPVARPKSLTKPVPVEHEANDVKDSAISLDFGQKTPVLLARSASLAEVPCSQADIAASLSQAPMLVSDLHALFSIPHTALTANKNLIATPPPPPIERLERPVLFMQHIQMWWGLDIDMVDIDVDPQAEHATRYNVYELPYLTSADLETNRVKPRRSSGKTRPVEFSNVNRVRVFCLDNIDPPIDLCESAREAVVPEPQDLQIEQVSSQPCNPVDFVSIEVDPNISKCPQAEPKTTINDASDVDAERAAFVRTNFTRSDSLSSYASSISMKGSLLLPMKQKPWKKFFAVLSKCNMSRKTRNFRITPTNHEPPLLPEPAVAAPHDTRSLMDMMLNTFKLQSCVHGTCA